MHTSRGVAPTMTAKQSLSLILPFEIVRPVHVTAGDLSDIKDIAQRQGLLMLLYSRIMRDREQITPRSAADEFLKELKPLYYANVARTVTQESVENRTAALLSSEGIPSIVLRGSAIARELYDDPYCRTSADIDILIRQRDLARADSILAVNGYTRSDTLPLKFWVHRIHHAVYRCPETNDLVEIHWTFGIPPFFRLTSDDIWADAVYHGEHRYRLSAAMNLIHLLMHHHMHAFRELKILTDIIWALDRFRDSIGWDTFGRKLGKIGLLKTALITKRQIETLCGAAAACEPALVKFKKAVEGMGRSEPPLLTAYFRTDPGELHGFQDKRDKVMARLALDDWRRILISFAGSLLPPPEGLKQLYGDRRNRMLPVHYSRFMRWRLSEWKN